jgi:hypothetical protein
MTGFFEGPSEVDEGYNDFFEGKKGRGHQN